jgi:hypothetical protein
MRQLFGLVALTLAVFLTPPPVAQQAATPGASPVASPVATSGCDGIGPYFQQVAGLVETNEGMQLIPGTASSIAGLSGADRVVIAEELTELIADLAKIVPPDPAISYHAAYISLVTWYRDLALATDYVAWQQEINTDRQVARNMGQGNVIGQATCGFAAWNLARDTAFSG